MLEDLTSTALENESIPLEENVSEYNCIIVCYFVTTNKARMSEHTDLQHKLNGHEEVNFGCINCLAEFHDENDYNAHMKHIKKLRKIMMTTMKNL